MKKFYLIAPKAEPNYSHIIKDNIKDFDDSGLFTGKGISPLPNDLGLVYQKKKKWTDYMNNYLGWRIFSDKIKNVILPFLQPEDKFHSIHLTCDTGKSTDKLLFWLLEVRTVIDAINYKKSTIREGESGKISGISNLAINVDAVPSHIHAFLLKEYSVCLVIDEKLKIAIETLNPEGFSFVECR